MEECEVATLKGWQNRCLEERRLEMCHQFIWSWPVWHLAYYQCPYGWCFNCQSPSAVPLGRKTWRLSAMLFQGRANVSIALVFLLALLHPNIFKNSTCKHLHFFNEHGLGYVRIKISKFLVFLAERKQRFCLNCISGGATNQQFHNDCNCVWQNASPKIKSAKCSRTYCIENETSCYALAAILVDGLLLASQHILNLKRDLFFWSLFRCFSSWFLFHLPRLYLTQVRRVSGPWPTSV